MKHLRHLAAHLLILLSIPAAGHCAGQESGCGDVFGDLVHIKRDAVTGQPILQKRWIEVPQGGEEWGYCPIPLDAAGNEIGFINLSCDPADPDAVVEVDYFGRLSGGRTKERNNRMHFDEVISSIKMADIVTTDDVGRLKFGFGCTSEGGVQCESWSSIDSPMENLALYTRVMRYGHLQTDPLEVDLWVHGDPAAGIQYHPALDTQDWAKFDSSLRHLLPASSGSYGTENLSDEDFIRAGAFLGGAADKNGKITVDLVQYLNRILKIPQTTEMSLPNANLLPALVRDCGPDGNLPVDQCTILPAAPGLPAPANEQFVNFSAANYIRGAWFNRKIQVLRPLSETQWTVDPAVDLLGWLAYANGPMPGTPTTDIAGFVDAAFNALKSVQFIHNYEVPVDLGWNFDSIRTGDVDGDNDLDKDDINLILAHTGQDVSSWPGYDIDGDGQITITDAEKATLLCTRTDCQTEGESQQSTRIANFFDGQWCLDLNGNRSCDANETSGSFGISGDVPVSGNWNGLTKTSIGVFRKGAWFLDMNGNGAWDEGTDAAYSFGIATDIPVTGDWNGSGATNLGVFRGGTWWFDVNGNGAWDEGTDTSTVFGIDGDIPVTGDWTGTGTTKIGVVRSNTWFLDVNGNGLWEDGIDAAYSLGLPGDVPVTGDWNGSGTTKIGVVRQSVWYLDVNGNGTWDTGVDAVTPQFGNSAGIPVTGQW